MIEPTGISSAEQFGAATIGLDDNQLDLAAVGILDDDQFGATEVQVGEPPVLAGADLGLFNESDGLFISAS